MLHLTILSALSLFAFIGSANSLIGQERGDAEDQDRVRRDRQALIENTLRQDSPRAENVRNAKLKVAEEIEARVAQLKELHSKLKAVENSDRADSAEDARHLEREIARIEQEITELYMRFRAQNGSPDRVDPARNRERRHAPDQRDWQNRDRLNREVMVNQLEHLRVAIPHLHESGMHDMAGQLEIRVRELEEQLHASQERRDPWADDRLYQRMDEMMGEIRNLANQVNELRREVNRLKNNDRR